MKRPKVSLYIRVVNAAGRSVYAKPVWNKNRTLRTGYAEGDPKHHPEGNYYLRFLREGKRVRERVGKEPDAALIALRKTEHELETEGLGLVVPTAQFVTPSVDSVASPTLADAVLDYLTDLKRFRAPATVKGATQMLTRFSIGFPGRLIAEITRKDLLLYMDSLKADGLSDRTIFNYQIRIGALLRKHGIVVSCPVLTNLATKRKRQKPTIRTSSRSSSPQPIRKSG